MGEHFTKSLSKGQTADVEIERLNSSIRRLETMHHVQIQDQARSQNEENVSFRMSVGD